MGNTVSGVAVDSTDAATLASFWGRCWVVRNRDSRELVQDLRAPRKARDDLTRLSDRPARRRPLAASGWKAR
jgi:hypothetical protein